MSCGSELGLGRIGRSIQNQVLLGSIHTWMHKPHKTTQEDGHQEGTRHRQVHGAQLVGHMLVTLQMHTYLRTHQQMHQHQPQNSIPTMD